MIDLKGNYLVERDGTIYSLKRKGQYMHPTINSRGYYVVTIRVDGVRKQCYVHKLVAETFIPNPQGKKCVHHIDGNKLNNSVENLIWLTEEEHSAIHNDKESDVYIFTDEMKKKMSMLSKGKKVSDETKKKISETMKGRPQSEEHKRKKAESLKKPIIQYDKNNNLIKRWKSAVDAERECGISRCHISSVCKGKRQSAGGYIWKFDG